MNILNFEATAGTAPAKAVLLLVSYPVVNDGHQNALGSVDCMTSYSVIHNLVIPTKHKIARKLVDRPFRTGSTPFC